MNSKKKVVLVLAVVALVAAVAAGVVILGGHSASTTASDSSTAMGSYDVAQSALTTAAPDAKLLVVQMLQSVNATGTPYWAYLFGSPSTDMGYLVYATAGSVMTWSEYGSLGLSAAEWAKVPDVKGVKIDSDEAYSKALAVSGATGTPNGYFMGLMTYKSAEDTSTVDPFQWNVWFEPGSSGATSNLILVDAKSGKATATASQ